MAKAGVKGPPQFWFTEDIEHTAHWFVRLTSLYQFASGRQELLPWHESSTALEQSRVLG